MGQTSRRLQTLPHDDTQGRMDMKTSENRGKELNNILHDFSSICHQKLERQCSTTIYASVIQYPIGKKKINVHYLTGQNQGLSGLKNIWQVIMTGNLLSILFSLGDPLL